MAFKMKLLAVILLVSLSVNITAQQSKKCPCCTENHNQFDFWIGEWTVFDVKGKILGTNIITKEYDNCVLKEQWTSTAVSKGTSYNYYDSKEKSWNQLWVDNSGFNLTLKGSYADGKMVLKSDLVDGSKGKFYNQITWQLNDDKSVTQVWETFSDKGFLLQELFKGIYKKTVK